MTFGEDWGWGASPDVSARMLDLFADAGGNVIDTADVYTNGTSETILGELLKGRRDRFVLGTKFTNQTDPGDPNSAGNHRKKIVTSIEASLDRKSTRLNSSHGYISYAVFCLKKKKKKQRGTT